MKYFEVMGRTILFGVIFFIGLNFLLHPENYQAEWKEALQSCALDYDAQKIIEGFGGILILFSSLSLLYTDKNYDLALLVLFVSVTAVVYNPFNGIYDEKSQLNILLIAGLLLQRTNTKKQEFIVKKDN
ncbi:hypothetical protein SteCoe_36659 [Stentor coeruleus]|uniref:DoxX family protein n=1 Tax=Stentor coeruleus TaxID=5963 RepID=A0A1R2APJ9_9CILI|nr:hypothetical protein SteCoe_36659 [Stentor coeruleus]